MPRSPLIWDAEQDVLAAHEYLRRHTLIDADRIAIVGASYSGEEMAEAGRLGKYATAYVALSPGSFGDESIAGIDASRVPWLFIVSRDERFLPEITATSVRKASRWNSSWYRAIVTRVTYSMIAPTWRRALPPASISS